MPAPARRTAPSTREHALEAQSVAQMVDHVLALPEDTKLMILAPVVAGRKGEQGDLFADLRAQGFVRVRVDGEVMELDALPALEKGRRHDVEVVIDRVKVRADLRGRLAESFETALTHADGRALAVEMDSGREHLFSARFACPVCGFALAELEPRLFSFNNPAGACPKCDGLGEVEFFDPARVVAHPELSLAAGAIRGWDRRNQFYFQMLASLAAHYAFDIETPWEALPERVREIVLDGSGRTKIAFRYMADNGRMVLKEHPFEGILPNLERRLRETDAVAVREELSKYRATRPCPACHGTRLRSEARHVLIGGRRCTRSATCRSASAATSSPACELAGARAQVAERIVKEIADRLELPDRRRAGLPVARPLRRHPLGRRGAAHPPGEPDRLGPDRRHVRARRALDRPAPARQRPPARHAGAACATSATR